MNAIVRNIRMENGVSYVVPALDKTPTEIRVTRPCWVGRVPVDAGTELTLPRWQAEQVISAGRAVLKM